MNSLSEANVPLFAQKELLNKEIEFLRFLARSGKNDNLQAAASLRVLDLQKELAKLEGESR